MPEAKFRIAQTHMPRAHVRIVGTEPHRLLDIGFGLLEAAEAVFSEGSLPIQMGGIRIDRESGVRSADRLIPAVRLEQVPAFRLVRPNAVGSERYGSVDLTDYSCL